MKKGVFIETQNVARFRSAMRTLSDVEKGEPGLAIVRGRAGRGKTMATLAHHCENGGVYLRVWQDWSQFAFLQSLCFEVKGIRPHGANDCKVQIMDALEQDPRTLYVDEADRLHMGRIEDLRDIHDVTGCPVVLIGEEGLYPKVNARRRIWSRVTQDIEFGAVTVDDVLLYGLEAADLRLSPEACHLVAKRADGDFRLVHVDMLALEQAAKASQTDKVNAKMVQSLPSRRRH